MKNIFLYISLLILFCFLSGFTFSEIPDLERAALIALYNSTNGDNWTNNSGWKTPPLDTDGFSMPGTEKNWHGIGVTSNHVTKIDFYDNNLQGTIPASLVDLSNLVNLWISSNPLTGSIPPELGNLSSLESLTLSRNQLNGSIPPELGNLKKLRKLKLYYNQLTGSIPPELGNLSSLENLVLLGNQLSGSIPSELGNLSNLQNLSLDHNQLIGSLPTELGNLSNLEWLQLYGNKLSGIIPSSFSNLTKLNPIGTDIGYNALYTNNNNLQIFLASKDPDWEETQTIAPTNLSAVVLSTSSIEITWTPITYTGHTGGYMVYYSNVSGDWTYSGITSNKLVTSYTVTGLNPGTTYYFVVKTQTDQHVYNYNTIKSEFSEEGSAQTGSLPDIDAPFGSFDTPIDESTVSSSIAVTGWALDDTSVDTVKIYREEGNKLIYIGDAMLVEGARPDVAAAYPDYPNNTKAGWGYMMLTNFLPNGGNGTFKIYAIATDLAGKMTPLGVKTIYCDNENAVKPFGAIDTPTQGGTASGSDYVNWGWVLTPMPNSIPTDGSTINVWVDGVNLGHPTYNIYRSDIATLFPDYANTDGAVGYFYLDTTAYANGVHTIQWTATDSGGNTDGIGSRYFTIQNSGVDARASAAMGHGQLAIGELPRIEFDTTQALLIQKGFKDDGFEKQVSVSDDGEYRIQTRELEPLKIKLNEGSSIVACYQLVGNSLRKMPVGMTLRDNTLYWMPGVAYIGSYRFVVVIKDDNGVLCKKFFNIAIEPKFGRIAIK